MVRAWDLSGLCSPWGLCRLLQTKELPGGPRNVGEQSSNKHTLKPFTNWLCPKPKWEMNCWGKCVHVFMCAHTCVGEWVKLLAKKTLCYIGIFSLDHWKLWPNECNKFNFYRQIYWKTRCDRLWSLGTSSFTNTYVTEGKSKMCLRMLEEGVPPHPEWHLGIISWSSIIKHHL